MSGEGRDPLCPRCGTLLDPAGFYYIRLTGPKSKGYWTCQGCGTRWLPNGDPEDQRAGPAFTEGERAKLVALKARLAGMVD